MTNQTIISNPIPLKLTAQQLNESTSKFGNKFVVEAVIQRADSKNENTRIYPRSVLEREIDKYVDGPVKEKRAYGELDHVETPTINLRNACLNIMKVWWEGDDVKALIEILNTPSGKIVQELLKAGLSVGISSRGTGSVSELDENTVTVDDDYTLICFDAVSAPSTHGAYFHPKSMNESVQPLQEDRYQAVSEIISDILCLNLGFCECQLQK